VWFKLEQLLIPAGSEVGQGNAKDVLLEEVIF
jgi:hypothetical protein